MNGGNNKSAAATAAPGTAAGGAPAVKERIFSIIIRKLEEGITDGRKRLWAWFSDVPHVLVLQNGDGYRLLLWREGVYVEITLDENFEITGFDVEVES